MPSSIVPAERICPLLPLVGMWRPLLCPPLHRELNLLFFPLPMGRLPNRKLLGTLAVELEVHIQSRSLLGDDAEENLITLCTQCHRQIHERKQAQMSQKSRPHQLKV
jgi:hypothetical protein